MQVEEWNLSLVVRNNMSVQEVDYIKLGMILVFLLILTNIVRNWNKPLSCPTDPVVVQMKAADESCEKGYNRGIKEFHPATESGMPFFTCNIRSDASN